MTLKLNTRIVDFHATDGRPPVLLTSDEARWRLGRSAVACLTSAGSDPVSVVAILWGVPVEGLDATASTIAQAHRETLAEITAAGHASIISDELEGICSATGLDVGELSDIDVIAQTFSGDPADPWTI